MTAVFFSIVLELSQDIITFLSKHREQEHPTSVVLDGQEMGTNVLHVRNLLRDAPFDSGGGL